MMKRILRLKSFSRQMKKSELTDQHLINAVSEMERGLIDAELGAGLVKKRIAIGTRGKRSSTRTLVATNHRGRWVFLFGFQKNQRANITKQELEALKMLSKDLLSLNNRQITQAVMAGHVQEINYDQETKQ